tara:strand:+ start:8128 stop:9195 length:1068 start_codon:yes stop_codon:yes gene_type:complete
MKKDVFLSASRIKTAKDCSWTYWCKYHLKLPDSSNDGASMGWICHLIFEILGNPRHKKHYKKILKENNIWSSDSIKKLVIYHAKKLSVNNDDCLDQINEMTLKGLKYDFFGDTNSKPSQSISEENFEIRVEQEGKRYNIRGFIDKLFFYKKESRAVIRDFKTNKKIYKGKEVTDNMQSLIYVLAVKYLYPEFVKRQMEFLFLRHPLQADDLFNEKGPGYMCADTVTDEELEGLEIQLSSIQEYLESFTEKIAVSNYAFDQHQENRGYPKDGTFGGRLMCGKDGPKISKGKPVLDENGEMVMAYICPFRKARDYFVILDDLGNVVSSADNEIDLEAKIKDNQHIEKREYAGCPRHL